MRYKNYLDYILGSKPKTRILRYLCAGRGNAPIREIAREIKMSAPNASIALAELEKEGVLASIRIGRSVVYSLNRGHFLVEKMIKPLFEQERKIKKEIAALIKRKITFPYETIILFGSVARGDEKPDSDIDLAIIIKDGESEKEAENGLAGVELILAEEFGSTISPIIFKRAEFLKKIKNNDPLVINIIKKGETIAGKMVSELL